MSAEPSKSEAMKSIVIHLDPVDFQIFEKYRGDLSPDAFMSALLRMIDTGAVRDTPGWIQPKSVQP
jgi:hypothetical protein